jgi:hypothetical protein
VVRTHEELCQEPVVAFSRLYAELGLSWNEEAEAYVVENNRPGKGFRTRRVAADLPGDWKQRLTAQQVTEMQRVLAWFPLETWSADDLSLSS